MRRTTCRSWTILAVLHFIVQEAVRVSVALDYVVIASEILRPNSIYKVVVICPGHVASRVQVVASVAANESSALSQGRTFLSPGKEHQILLLRIPSSLDARASYRLRVEGALDSSFLAFKEEKWLKASNEFLSIVIGTNKVVFNAEHVIRIRAVLLKTDGLPYQGATDLFLLDPDGFTVRKWNSVHLNNGMLLQKYQLPLFPKVGFWTIRIRAEDQVEELVVKVEKHYLPLYELVVASPAFVMDTDESIEASVEGAFVTERLAKGNVEITWKARATDVNWTPSFEDSLEYRQQYAEAVSSYSKYTYQSLNVSQEDFNVTVYSLTNQSVESEWTFIKSDSQLFRWDSPAEPFTLDLEEVERVMGTKNGIQVRADANLTEYFYNKTELAFADTRIVSRELKMSFLGSSPVAFRPGTRFHCHLRIVLDGFIPLSRDQVEEAKITIRAFAWSKSNQTLALKTSSFSSDVPCSEKDSCDETVMMLSKLLRDRSLDSLTNLGVLSIWVDTPEEASQLKIETMLKHPDLGSHKAELRASAAETKGGAILSVISSSLGDHVKVGDYAVFHLKKNFFSAFAHYLVLSKNVILSSGTIETADADVSTFTVVVNSEMSPAFTLVVLASTLGGEVASDSLTLPVVSRGKKLSLSTTQVKDHLQLSVEFAFSGHPGATVVTATMRTSLFAIQGHYTLTGDYVLQKMMAMQQGETMPYKAFVGWPDGRDKVVYLPAFESKTSVLGMFSSKHLLLMSNLDCGDEDTSSEVPAQGDEADIYRQEVRRFLLSRQSRFEDFYDVGDGDWGWTEANMDHDGEQFLTLILPETPDSFFTHAFSISADTGIDWIDEPIVYSTTRPIDFYCEAAPTIRRGESVGVMCSLLNRSPDQPIEGSVILRDGAPDYSFIHVESFGHVTSYAPRLSSGDYYHYVWLRPEGGLEVRVPVAIHLEMGTVDINLEFSSQITTIFSTVSIDIMPEGSVVHKHTSLLLDVKNRANVLRFMNIVVDETPIIPYEVYRRFISGSPSGQLLVSGDAIGPVFPGDSPVGFYSMFPSGNARYDKGSMLHVFNIGANTWQLHYLRLTNQIRQELASKVFERLNLEYVSLLRRFSAHGWLSNWDDSAPSVWLTAWALAQLAHAAFHDWEPFIYIDPLVISSGVTFILNYQSSDGSFVETEPYMLHPLHDPAGSRQNVSLTAHVLIALETTASLLQSDIRGHSSVARSRAASYLERHVLASEDAYEVTISAFALALNKSPMTNLVFDKMMAMARTEGGMTYWSRTEITTNRVRYEFNRPFVEPKDQQPGDALSVECTAYGLLTLFEVEGGGVTFTQEKIVQWLNTMRLGQGGGFIEAVDTLLAMQALVVYSYNSRIKDLTDLRVQVELPQTNRTEVFHFAGDDLARGQSLDLDHVWGHVNLFAAGAGQAVAQLDVTYGVDYDGFKAVPPTDCFRLSVRESFHGRNKSEVSVETCFSWTLTSDSMTSGPALLAVDSPSGYVLEQWDADVIVKSRIVPEMTAADSTWPGKTVWFFDRVPNQTRCFMHTVRRYFPVANLTRTRQAVLMESLRPSRFVVQTFNATSLYVLSICEVCGSFQCPYCPFYSGAEQHHGAAAFITSIVFSLLTCHTRRYM